MGFATELEGLLPQLQRLVEAASLEIAIPQAVHRIERAGAFWAEHFSVERQNLL